MAGDHTNCSIIRFPLPKINVKTVNLNVLPNILTENL
jgi:hypothetical protein